MVRTLPARATVLCVALLALTGCAESATPETGAGAGTVEVLDSPAGLESSAPNLTVGENGRIYLTWIEPQGEEGHALRFATFEGDRWSAARTVASGSHWIVNWADFPAMTALPGGRLAAHYLERPAPTEGGPYAYDVRVVQSSDDGETWSAPVTPHRDSALAEHGFVSLFAGPGDSLGVAWLDGRSFVPEYGGTEEMSLRSVFVGPDGGLGGEALIDAKACDCCQTSVAPTEEGPVIVYRDRSEGEIRDIYLSRLAGDRWSEGRPVHGDGWEINACPVNGPSVASDTRSRVVVAWFSGARDSAQVKVSFSDDAGESFGAAIPVDEGRPVGRVDVEMLADGSALVSWIESGEGNEASVLVRRVAPDGRRSAPVTITASSGTRSSGFPHMALSGERLVFAWTDPGSPTRVLTARSDPPRLEP